MTAGTERARVAAVLIGRNEGERLVSALAAARPQAERLVYVDSGSTDGSVAAARAARAEVVELDLSVPFTAARARNAGFDRLRDAGLPEFVQFIDGDCVLDPAWIATAMAFLDAHPDAAVACGRRREIAPEASVYNRLIDQEWNTPVGEARACGGDALMRVTAFEAAGGYNPALIAGEEPELCVRLRAAGWTVWRLDAEMTRHDAALSRFGQWWTRARRAGHAYAEGAALHGAPPERHYVAELRRALVWGLAIPVAMLFGALLLGPWAFAAAAVYPLQALRLYLRNRDAAGAVFLVLGKFAEAQGALQYAFGRLTGARTGLIEYK